MAVVRGVGTDDVLPAGGLLTTNMTYTLATYTAAGTAAPAAGDIVIADSGANSRVVMAADNDIGNLGIGRVKRANTTDLTVVVEWFNVYAVVELTTDDVTTATRGNSAIKDGNTTVVDNFDAGATSGNMIVWALSGTAGAGTLRCAVVITGK